MLNRPLNAFSESAAEGGWDVDAHPASRLGWLWVLMVLPLVVIACRLAWIQCLLTDDYVAAFDVTTESFETIPKRDGRILSADGRVLADDLPQFDVHVHYRWAESPSNPAWLRQQALARLDKGDRRKKDRVAETQRDVLARREAMWSRLAELTGQPSEQLEEQRIALQQRIERMSGRIEWSRRERDTASREDETHPTTTAPWWQRGWEQVVVTLTTPPHREAGESVVVQEELRHHLLLENVPFDVAAEIQSHPEQFPGLRIETSTTRIYPQGPLAPHLVGSRLPMNDDELAERQQEIDRGSLAFQPGDRIGRAGIERSYDAILRGTRGERRIVRNRRGDVVTDEVTREPRMGRDVVLTLHLDLQERLERLLDRSLDSIAKEAGDSPRPPSGAAIVAIDVHTGAVLAAASAPRFDLDLFVHPNSVRWKELLEDPRRPFFDRALQMTLPPGSVFKPLTAVAILESGQVHPDDSVNCIGYLDTPERHRCYIYNHYKVGHGATNLSEALAQSCNVYFYANARKVGPEPIVAWAERFGFGSPTGIDLPGEAGGNLPRPPAKKGSAAPQAGVARPKPWYSGDTLGLAIGQSRLLVTPMQIARLMAAIANGGSLVTPHVVRDVDDSNHDTTERDDDDVRSVGLSPRYGRAANAPQRIPGLHDATLGAIREGLERVVSDRKGTAYKTVRMKEVAIAGKTGTAEVGGGKPDHAWFAGYVPADHPRIAFVVVLEHAGSGGRAAGPLAKEMVQILLEFGLLQPSEMAEKGSAESAGE